VKATCESIDTTRRWTDNCPLPVLAVAFLLTLWACSMPMAGVYGMPFFGHVFRGSQALAISLVMITVSLGLAWAAYKQSIVAWWGTIVLVLVYWLSAAVTFSRLSLIELYEQMGMSEKQLELMRGMDFPPAWVMLAAFVVSGSIFLGFMMYTKKFFTGNTTYRGA
jgi:hypothetical protein